MKIELDAEIQKILHGIRLNERQLCKFWSITPETLRKWRGNGYGPIYLKIGGRVLYRSEDILAFEHQTRYRSSGDKIKDTGVDYANK